MSQYAERILIEIEQKLSMRPSQGDPQPAKLDLNKKSFSKQKTIQNFTIDAQGFRKTRNENSPTWETRAHGWQIGWHWLAGNSHFPCGRIFIFCFSEPLAINSEVLNYLLLWKGLFI